MDESADVNVVYEGIFENGKREGNGRQYIENGSFSLDSKFIEDQPEYEANQVILRIPKREVVED